MAPGLSYCQVMIGRAMTGLIGLQEIMERLAEEGVSADGPDAGRRLVSELRAHNYVPPVAQAQYEAALAREYRRFLEARTSGTGAHVWRDPRKEHAPWYPTIFEAKCNGCGDCLTVCPHDVLGWDPAGSKKVLVLEPYECAPGCTLCAKACGAHAIIMPPREVLHRSTAPNPASSPMSAGACASCSVASCDACN